MLPKFKIFKIYLSALLFIVEVLRSAELKNSTSMI